ncbi:MAG TPA: tRNA uridine-5-carboxymethylaminomethyl(34) synthesis GTPase MnmE [Candidatus Omnitrophota bacterium]|nr:tRNA uridine-5-carboxymethylaminomethyl(34) synthesis GTPase MnmE [Candidatus Omnitrophota bacterium]HPN56511.1 tRNA uridine-5-carboxymethylaminomethyl(34) synthesis GTPase MnmE [Candidatus Omnitrophota bacterium]
MDPLYKFDDTIAAIATPPGQGGIGIVRLSGPRALAVADKIFHIKSGRLPSECLSHTVHFGHVVQKAAGPTGGAREDQDFDMIDEALLVVMRGPKSYTGEDVVELNCHGGAVILATVLRLVIEQGARLAEPGEFTKRAFLRGRMDLTQAEAVLDIIRAKTEAFVKISAHQLKGDLTAALGSIRERLMDVYTGLEAAVNFPEDDIQQQSRFFRADSAPGGVGRPLSRNSAGPLAATEQALAQIRALIATSTEGRILRDGIKAVICGKPNVGKSSLLNRLLRQPRAIVSPLEGTTRDTIEEPVSINGIPFQLVDTAGILHPRGLIEEEAVRRSRLCMGSADLIIFVLDGSKELSAEDEALIPAVTDKNALIVVNKCDLPLKVDDPIMKKFFPGHAVVRVSALTEEGIPELLDRMFKAAVPSESHCSRNILISNTRHAEALFQAERSLLEASAHFASGLSLEFVSEDVKAAIRALDQITGRDIDMDLLDKIFSEFCIGK